MKVIIERVLYPAERQWVIAALVMTHLTIADVVASCGCCLLFSHCAIYFIVLSTEDTQFCVQKGGVAYRDVVIIYHTSSVCYSH